VPGHARTVASVHQAQKDVDRGGDADTSIPCFRATAGDEVVGGDVASVSGNL
jgi:hypothetical protein